MWEILKDAFINGVWIFFLETIMKVLNSMAEPDTIGVSITKGLTAQEEKEVRENETTDKD